MKHSEYEKFTNLVDAVLAIPAEPCNRAPTENQVFRFGPRGKELAGSFPFFSSPVKRSPRFDKAK
jgi:hypothetical protein